MSQFQLLEPGFLTWLIETNNSVALRDKTFSLYTVGTILKFVDLVHNKAMLHSEWTSKEQNDLYSSPLDSYILPASVTLPRKFLK